VVFLEAWLEKKVSVTILVIQLLLEPFLGVDLRVNVNNVFDGLSLVHPLAGIVRASDQDDLCFWHFLDYEINDLGHADVLGFISVLVHAQLVFGYFSQVKNLNSILLQLACQYSVLLQKRIFKNLISQFGPRPASTSSNALVLPVAEQKDIEIDRG